MENYFSYETGPEEIKDCVRISSSQISYFFDRTSEWYRQTLLGEKFFLGNTSSFLGTTLHGAMHMYYDTKSIDWSAIDDFVRNINKNNPEIKEHIDHVLISDQVKHMIPLAIRYFDDNKPDEVEKFVYHRTRENIVVGGTIDAVRGSTIYDWKTTNLKTPPNYISRNYWFQQMTYAWVMKKLGHPIESIRLVFITRNETGRISEKTGKPMKDYPSQLAVVSQTVEQEHLDIIENTINLITESIETWQKNPEIRHLLAQDYRLKFHSETPLFIN